VTALSPDGTRIEWRRDGAGPAVVLVHGASGDRGNWVGCTPCLADRLSVYTVDRRGRGRSTDGPPGSSYSIEREYEDIAAVVEAAAAECGGPVNLVGHSYGAIVSLGAARLTDAVGRLVLYEPPLLLSRYLDVERIVEAVERHLLAGRPAEAATEFFRHAASAEELATIRAFAPGWRQIERDAGTLPRELRSVAALADARYTDVNRPTLLLVGELSPDYLVASVRELAAMIPAAQVSVLAGQRHLAQAFAPEAFCTEVVRFVGI
jgi:pimeloyl-ACP methyl ester carboxylesterase